METGYWPLYRYNPTLLDEGKNPFVFEYKTPDGTLQAFLGGENRYAQLEKINPEGSKKMRQEIETEYNQRFAYFSWLASAQPNVLGSELTPPAESAPVAPAPPVAPENESKPALKKKD